jgi:hypothetical protein
VENLIKITHDKDGATVYFHSPHNTKYSFASLQDLLAALPELAEVKETHGDLH